jgi:hypothetical protein
MKLVKILQEALEEDASLNYAGKKVKMRLKPNINPTKQGIKIQFSFGGGDLDPDEKDAFTTSLQTILNKALSPYGMSVNSDPDVPNQGEEVVGFYLTIEQFETFIKKALKETLKTAKKPEIKKNEPDEPEEEEDSEEA